MDQGALLSLAVLSCCLPSSTSDAMSTAERAQPRAGEELTAKGEEGRATTRSHNKCLPKLSMDTYQGTALERLLPFDKIQGIILHQRRWEKRDAPTGLSYHCSLSSSWRDYLYM